MKTLRRTWAEIDLDHLEHNYRAIRKTLPEGCAFLGVIKADAYGHGAVPVSAALSRLGAEYLAVSNLDEAVQIRREGILTPILILGYTPSEYADTLVFMNITQEVHSLDYAKELEERLQGTNYVLNVHIKLDTGMTRLGFFVCDDNQLDEAAQIAKLTHLHVEGVFTHFCAADSKLEADRDYTLAQYHYFTDALAYLEQKGIKPERKHCANSGATILYPQLAMDMVRPGIALYGLSPSSDTAGILDLKPVMSLHTSIAQIREVPKGTQISYGRTYAAERPLRMAVLPVGYADGLPRSLSGRVSLRLHGKDAPIIGRICMDMCMVDITDIPDAASGDTLTLFGYDELGVHIPCEDIAVKANTIGYELLCAVSKRIPRIYLEGGKQSDILQYIV